MVTTIIAFAVVVSIIVFVHELGHFLAAKRSGVRVDVFSIGMGPRLAGVTAGETDYRISAIPFGGYVRMAGDNPEEERTGMPYEFLSQPKRVRALIVVAGPLMNLVLAIAIFIGLNLALGDITITSRIVGKVYEDTPAWEAGLRAGDEVLSIDGIAVGKWDDLMDMLDERAGGEARITVMRDGEEITARLDLTDVEVWYESGLEEFRGNVVGTVKRGGPAYVAGIREGDRIIEIAGKPVRDWNELREAIMASPNEEIEIVYERDGQVLRTLVTPREADGYGLIDVAFAVERRSLSVPEALGNALSYTAWAARQILVVIHRLLTGQASRDMIGGPIRIGQLAGETVRWGIANILFFIATISAQLCLINLLPIPVLDGGHLMLLGVEAVSQKPITIRQRIIAHQIGFALLLGVILAITLFDVSRLIGR